MARFDETQLPPKEAFFSKLSDEDINEADYAHAQQVWKTFGCKTKGDYSDLYCTVAPTSCFWQMSLRRSGKRAPATTDWTHLTITRPQASAGKPYSRRQKWGSSYSKTTTSICSSRRSVEESQWSQSAMSKPTILWSRAMTQKSQAVTSSTWTRIPLWLGDELAFTHRRLPVGRGLRAASQKHCRSSSRRSRWLYPRGGSGIPRRAAQGEQRLPTSSRAHDYSRRVDVGVSAKPPRRWGGAN